MLPPQMTRLVKLLYLAELEYYRRTQKRLTQLEWKFFHYGPYPLALMDILGNPNVESIARTGGTLSKQLIREGVIDEPTTTKDHDIDASINMAVKEWGDAGLNALLDFVYFETAPMQKARRGDVLDLTLSLPVRKRIALDINKQELRSLRTRLSRRAAEFVKSQEAATVSDSLFRGLSVWDEDFATTFPSGACTINVDDLGSE